MHSEWLHDLIFSYDARLNAKQWVIDWNIQNSFAINCTWIMYTLRNYVVSITVGYKDIWIFFCMILMKKYLLVLKCNSISNIIWWDPIKSKLESQVPTERPKQM